MGSVGSKSPSLSTEQPREENEDIVYQLNFNFNDLNHNIIINNDTEKRCHPLKDDQRISAFCPSKFVASTHSGDFDLGRLLINNSTLTRIKEGSCLGKLFETIIFQEDMGFIIESDQQRQSIKYHDKKKK